ATWTKSDSTSATNAEIQNRLDDMVDNLIVIGDIGDGRSYYKTKAGGTIKIWDADLGEGKMRIAGGYQVEQDTFVTVKTIYDQSVSGNGKSYILEDAPLLSSKKSLYATLKEKPEFKVFYDLMEGSDFFVTQMNKHACVDRNCNLFNAFNYTVYVPTNESLQALLDDGTLPTWEEYELETDAEIKKAIKDSIESFLKYHIQDNSVFLDKAAVSGNFETSAMNQETGRFYKLSVEGDGIQGLVLTDLRGNQRRVVQSDAGLYNLMVREYLFDNADKERATSIFASSYASVHQIDGPLFFK
ncbi:MAG: fasciclin domain-containing protein, partial [Bacteroidales bacterium]|nr:fasciclin domain-containing protein [Bacteroidales bacterium]